jgi:hypothetical protein
MVVVQIRTGYYIFFPPNWYKCFTYFNRNKRYHLIIMIWPSWLLLWWICHARHKYPVSTGIYNKFHTLSQVYSTVFNLLANNLFVAFTDNIYSRTSKSRTSISRFSRCVEEKLKFRLFPLYIPYKNLFMSRDFMCRIFRCVKVFSWSVLSKSSAIYHK